jgi:hypothetical protein
MLRMPADDASFPVMARLMRADGDVPSLRHAIRPMTSSCRAVRRHAPVRAPVTCLCHRTSHHITSHHITSARPPDPVSVTSRHALHHARYADFGPWNLLACSGHSPPSRTSCPCRKRFHRRGE